ncbi:MAG: CYTH and CHAD domain-containing protein [Devosia sp.]
MSRSAQRAVRRGIVAVVRPDAKAASFEEATDARDEAGDNAPAKAEQRTVETELKLLCDRERLADFAGSPTIAGYAHRAGKDVDLTAVYYDTPGLALRRSGTVLRVRTDGAHFVMTLKSRRRKAGKALERTERSAPVKSMEPDLAALARFLAAETFARIKAARLESVFRTEVRRHTRTLDTPLGTVDVALDQGRIVAGERSEEISEIELELVEGSSATLFQLALDLASHAPLRPSIRSKAARGYDLAFNSAPKIPSAPKMKFHDGVILDEALAVILRSALQHLLESQAAAEDGRDPDGLHQFRVALRRLRSVLGLLRSIVPSRQLDGFREDAKWLMSNLNDARAWDVFITETVPPIARACPAVTDFDLLLAAAERHRRRAHAVAGAAIAAPRTGRLQIALGLWVEQAGWRVDASPESLSVLSSPARGFAARVLEKLHHKVVQRGSDFRQLSAEERHKLRLALKKLRYVADFFLPLFGKSKHNRHYGKTLAWLQDHLGRTNDMAVMEELVQRVLKDNVPTAGSRAGAALLGWKAGSLNRGDPELLAAWSEFQTIALP